MHYFIRNVRQYKANDTRLTKKDYLCIKDMACGESHNSKARNARKTNIYGKIYWYHTGTLRFIAFPG